MLKELTLANVGQLNQGRIEVAFQQQLAKLIEDCEDRPGETKSRKLVLELEVAPVVLQDGACTDVSVVAHIRSKAPEHVGGTVQCMIKHGGKAVFNDMSEDDPGQMTLDQQENGDD